MKINIFVLNYNGEELIPLCLPSLIKAKDSSRYTTEVFVIDNESTDCSLGVLQRFIDDAHIIRHPNRFLCSFNTAVASFDSDIVVLLNSDIKVEPTFLDYLVGVFLNQSDVFMVAPQCWTFDRSQYEGMRTRIKMKFGFFQAFSRYPGYEAEIERPGYTANAGSVVAFRRDRFLELGGYDDLYLPGRVEDVDICYRGWKRGYKAYYAPESLAYHKGMASFKKAFGYRKALTLSYRNTFLFIWKNITDKRLLLEHIVFLFPWLLFSLQKLNFSFVQGFIQALPKFTAALSRRKKERPYFKKTDRELLELLGWKKSR
jgi:GT2 family glycosyltransferase